MSMQPTKLLPGVLCALALVSAPAAMAAPDAAAPAAAAEHAQSGTKSALSTPARKFVKEAAMGDQAEMRLGELAVKKGASDDVRAFGQMMMDHHSKAASDLKASVADTGMKLPTALDTKHKKALDRLGKLSGEAFDREYMKMMVSEHEKDLATFRNASKQLSDPQVKEFATTALPTLESHLDRARQVAKTVGAAS